MSARAIVRQRRIEAEVLNVLAGAQCTGPLLRLTGQLDRKLYVRTNEVLEALGGKWDKKTKAHVFEDDASELVDSAILTGTFAKSKEDFGFFESPDPVVNRLLEVADVPDGAHSLEPSAGRGAIAVRLSALSGSLQCYELLPENAEVLRSKLNGSGIVEVADFLTIEPEPKYDRIVMNPPFARRSDIHHILHAARFLKPGGRLVSVASASISFRDDRLASKFRDFVAERDGNIEDLPTNSFKASGTDVNTAIVTFSGGPS